MHSNTLSRRARPWALALLCFVSVLASAQGQKSSQDSLPEMGTAAQEALSLEDENQIGRMVMRNLRESGMILDDPEVHEYIQSLGLRLSSFAQDGNRTSISSWSAIRRSTRLRCPAVSSASTRA